MIFVHPSAVVNRRAVVGDGTRIWHFVHVRERARIGVGCTIGNGAYIGVGVEIGDRVRIQNGAQIFAGVRIESDAFIGPGVVFTNVRRPRPLEEGEVEETIVRRGAGIGANATIRCGVEIGEAAFVGAGAVVLEDVLPGVTVAGNPARRIK